MLRICSKVLLITTDKKLAVRYNNLATSCDIEMRIVSEWNPKFRITEDLVICDSAFVNDIGKEYYNNTVVILKENESFIDYKNDFSGFLFNKKDERELLYSFVKHAECTLITGNIELMKVLQCSATSRFIYGPYSFAFDLDIYTYKNKGIYLTDGEKSYLALWLLRGRKDNKRRQVLFGLRQKFGKEFLTEIDRLGNVKEE